MMNNSLLRGRLLVRIQSGSPFSMNFGMKKPRDVSTARLFVV